MAYREITQEEVRESSQTASKPISMTIPMPPLPENFPQFSQNEANVMQTEENAVSGHLAKTPTQEFASFNRQVDANGSEANEPPKQSSKKEDGNGREQESELTTDAYGNKYEVRPIDEKEDSIKEKKGQSSPFQKYKHCSTKDIDNDNLETDDEVEPIEPFYKQLFCFNPTRRRSKKIDKLGAFENLEPSASGSMLGAESKSRNPMTPSHLNNLTSSSAHAVGEKRTCNGIGQRSASKDDVPATGKSEGLSEGPQEMNRGANAPDPNFTTEIVYSKERAEEIIEAEPECNGISVIRKMWKAPPEQPKMSTLESIRQKIFSLAERLNPVRKWSQSRRENEARMALKHREVDLDALIRDEPRENTERDVVNDHTKSTEDLEEQTNLATESEENDGEMMQTADEIGIKEFARKSKRTASSKQNLEEMILDTNTCGTKELEAQVVRITNPVASVRTCTVVKSNSVKSVAPIIEDASKKSGGEETAPRSVHELQNTRDSIISNLEGTTLRRKRKGDTLHDEFLNSIDEVIMSHENSHLMPGVDMQDSSALREFLETITTNNFISSNNRSIDSQETPALMSEAANDSIQDNVDFGAPLCRCPSRKPSAEKTRDTENGMNVNQHHNNIFMSRTATMSSESVMSFDQRNNPETSMTVGTTPEEQHESRNLEHYISTMSAVDVNRKLEVQRILKALKRYDTKLETIQESDSESPPEASQESNSEPPSPAATTNTSESSTGIQQQSTHRVFRQRVARPRVTRPKVTRRKRRSMRFEPYNDNFMAWERKRLDMLSGKINRRHSIWRRSWELAEFYELSDRMRSDTFMR